MSEYNYEGEGETHHGRESEPYLVAVVCSSYAVFRDFVREQARDRGYIIGGNGARRTVGPFLFCYVNMMQRVYGTAFNDWTVEGPAFEGRQEIIQYISRRRVRRTMPLLPTPKNPEPAAPTFPEQRVKVFTHVSSERDFQDKLFPTNSNLEPQDFLHIIQEYVDQGRKQYVRSKDGTAASIQLRHVMRKIAALAVASLEFNGSAHPKTDPRKPLI